MPANILCVSRKMKKGQFIVNKNLIYHEYFKNKIFSIKAHIVFLV